MSKTSKDILEEGGRVPPQAPEVEEAVLGSMLIEQEATATALQMLEFSDFYKPAHQHIFKQIGELYDTDETIDMLTVEQRLRDKGLLDTVGGSGYINELTRSVSSAANIDYHAQIIKEKSLKRDTILGCSDVIKEAYQSDSDPYEVLDKIGLSMENPNSVTGVPSGTDVDEYTSGWQDKDLILVAARPSMGKTAYALNAARFAAMCKYDDLRRKVAIFSLEMSNEALVKRFLCMESGINQQHAKNGRLKEEEYEKMCTEVAAKLNQVGIYVDDTPALDVRTLKSKARRLVRNKGVGLIIIDYIQLMAVSARTFNTREQEVAYLSRNLKGIAKELNVPVVALSQLSRAPERRNPPRPKLADLRESGQLEQDADVVLFLYRPEYYDITTTAEGKPTEKKAEIIIGKQRNGPTANVWLNFFKESGRFRNLSEKYDDEDAPF